MISLSSTRTRCRGCGSSARSTTARGYNALVRARRRARQYAKAVAAPISVDHLTKVFRVHEREEGMVATLRSLFARRFKEVPAVQDVSFNINEGEIVGFL